MYVINQCVHACMHVITYVCMHACMHASMHVVRYVCMKKAQRGFAYTKGSVHRGPSGPNSKSTARLWMSYSGTVAELAQGQFGYVYIIYIYNIYVVVVCLLPNNPSKILENYQIQKVQ